MPDRRLHRGPHPEDGKLFADAQLPSLRDATADLSWLYSRGYASTSALKIVGDRYSLEGRQRVAVARCACSDQAKRRRQASQVSVGEIKDLDLWIDGFNVLTSVEAALSDGVILHGRDGCYRDLASMHGTYRTVEETVPAIRLVGELLTESQVAKCHWLLDQPVSNSGRLKQMLQEIATQESWNWQAEVVADPDPVLSTTDRIVVTADSSILDEVEHWTNIARFAIDKRIKNAWILDSSSCAIW